jgi:hypothetical protein
MAAVSDDRDVLRQEVAVVTKDEVIAGFGLINVIW